MEEANTVSEDGTHVLRAEGLLDGKAARGIREEIVRLASQEGTRTVVLEMSKITQFDSQSLGVLVSIGNQTAAYRVGFAIVGVQGAAMDTLAITRLDRVLPLHDTFDEAMSALRSES
jgi:anti-sigma B factor antagonist